MAAQRSNKSSGGSEGGCAVVLIGGVVLIGLAVKFWYVTLTIVVAIAVAVIAHRHRERVVARRRAGRLDPWLNETVVALADLGFTEFARNQRRAVGGVPVAGEIEVRARRLRVHITMLGSEQAVHRAEMALRADPQVRASLRNGYRALVTRSGVLFDATGPSTVVDEALFDEVVRVVGRLPVDMLSDAEFKAMTAATHAAR